MKIIIKKKIITQGFIIDKLTRKMEIICSILLLYK